MHESVIEILRQRARENVRILGCVRDPPSGNGLMRVGKVDAGHGEAAPGREDQSREEVRDVVLAAVALAEQRDVRSGGRIERHAIDAIRPAVFGIHQSGHRDLAGERGDRSRGLFHQLCIDHPRGLELRDDLLVLDPDVLLGRIPREELLPRREDVLVGGEHGDQGAERQLVRVAMALDHQIPADGVEEERRDLPEEVVQELDEELALEDVEANGVDPAEPVADVRALAVERVVAADLGGARDRFANLVGKLARLLHALLRQEIDLFLQARDQPYLRRIERDRGEPQPEVLHENEDHVRDEQATLERGEADRLADEAADRVGLGDDHRDDLAGGHGLELRERKAQDLLIKIVAHPAQRAFADDAAVHVEPVLDHAVQRDEREQQERQRHQVRDLRNLEAQHRLGDVLSAYGVVDDFLRNCEVDVDQRKAERRDDQQQHLIAPGVLEDIAE